MEAAFRAGVDAVEPRKLVRGWLEEHEIGPSMLIAIGKAAPAMAQGALDTCDVEMGVVVTTREQADAVFPFPVFGAGHPLPDQIGLEAGEYVEEVMKNTREDDVVLVLISGGGSALLPSPRPPLTLEGLMTITEALLEKGASIQEMNTVRRHLERLKGGGLARICKGRIVSLLISDVIGDQLESIASGPTAPDPSTCKDALDILDKYGARMSDGVRERLQDGEWESEKPDIPLWSRVENHILANNRTAVEAAARKMEELFGRKACTVPEPLIGEAWEEGKRFAELVEEKSLVAAGGETIVRVRGNGKGGRNQEMALSALDAGGGAKGALLFASTDGRDGPTDAAGAFCDMEVKRKGKGLEPRAYLDDNDSYGFFSRTGALLITGSTGTNVCDLALGAWED